jgi:asparagine synthase (glutamine-hydrolysing)
MWKPMRLLPFPARQAAGHLIQAVPEPTWDRLGNRLPGAVRIASLGGKAHKLAVRLQGVARFEDLYRSLVRTGSLNGGIVRGACDPVTVLSRAIPAAAGHDPAHRMMLWDALTYLPDDILHKVDRASMAVSLETRAPFLDHRVAEFAWRLPMDMKVRNGRGKWLVRQLLDRYVPRELVERPKMGFGIPVGAWLRGPLRGWAEELLNESRLQREGYFEPAPVREKWVAHLSGQRDWSAELWCVLMFQAWHESARS